MTGGGVMAQAGPAEEGKSPRLHVSAAQCEAGGGAPGHPLRGAQCGKLTSASAKSAGSAGTTDSPREGA